MEIYLSLPKLFSSNFLQSLFTKPFYHQSCLWHGIKLVRIEVYILYNFLINSVFMIVECYIFRFEANTLVSSDPLKKKVG